MASRRRAGQRFGRSPSGRRAAKDPLFKKVADHYLALPKTYAIWGDAQELKNTYQK